MGEPQSFNKSMGEPQSFNKSMGEPQSFNKSMGEPQSFNKLVMGGSQRQLELQLQDILQKQKELLQQSQLLNYILRDLNNQMYTSNALTSLKISQQKEEVQLQLAEIRTALEKKQAEYLKICQTLSDLRSTYTSKLTKPCEDQKRRNRGGKRKKGNRHEISKCLSGNCNKCSFCEELKTPSSSTHSDGSKDASTSKGLYYYRIMLHPTL
ncbi:uncharacterized protein LOC102807672 [Saccoglossus kowalevskii]|uniref:Myosin heavy chain, cardiac muscle isoform-like n=1 Tax=Saccoglossus kowalevskii TaxID=10224 RepID=A0ABM0MSR2_SACKO|nr:PREDICTED: myosin heavy chain, cardiac muscle isoform-like [Saccoglossus kowalevskii]